MPHKRYTTKLTDEEILELFQEGGSYTADIEEGIVYSNKTGQPLFTFMGSERSTAPYVRLYKNPAMRAIAVSRIIWIVATQRAIPEGFQIHHRDRDPENNCFENLLALSDLDHDKVHREAVEEIPF